MNGSVPFPHHTQAQPLARHFGELHSKDIPEVLLSVLTFLPPHGQTDSLWHLPQDVHGLIMRRHPQVDPVDLFKEKGDWFSPAGHCGICSFPGRLCYHERCFIKQGTASIIREVHRQIISQKIKGSEVITCDRNERAKD